MKMRWNLDKLYTSFDSLEFKKDYESFKNSIESIKIWARENFKSADSSAKKLEYYINFSNDFSKYYKLFSFASLSLSVDSADDRALKVQNSFRNEVTEMSEPNVLFEKYVGSIGNLDEVINSSKLLREHEFMLKEIKSQAKYMLSEKEEIIYSKMKTTGSDSWQVMKEQLAATLMVDILHDGKTSLPLTIVRNLAYDPNPETRKKAYHAEIEAYKKIDTAVAFALNSIKGEVLTNVKLRGYESAIDMTLQDSRMRPETLEAMFSAIKDFLPALRKFYHKKAEVLGHKNGLPFYDIFAPVGKVNMSFTYEEAAEFVTKNFYNFSKSLGDYAKKAFDNNWIDAEPRHGKRGGAFCSNLHSIGESRIMANFSGSFSNTTTLAHELGHGYHGDCLKSAKYLNTRYTMPIAETASTFCETIVCNAALKTATADEAFVILENELSDMGQVIVDIYSRFIFETNLFKERENGPLSVDELNKMMLAAQSEAYGDSIDHNFPHQYMWLNKTHYYGASRNFYNFPYAYGLLFALGLYSEYLKTGAAFTKKYDDLLAATGANSLEEIGRLAGIDVTSKAFWVSSLKIFEGKINEFCNFQHAP